MLLKFMVLWCLVYFNENDAFGFKPNVVKINYSLKNNNRAAMETTMSMPKWVKSAILGVSLFASSGIVIPDMVQAADTVKVGKCLLQSCQKELGECILNPKCLANVVCLNTCNGRADEAECQIKCGDTFENDVVGRFNTCAVSKKKCVPQKQDEGLYPIPT